MSDERNVGHWRNDTDPIKRAIAAVVAYSWAHTGAFEELQALSEELRALIGIKERLAAVEAERDALGQALIDAEDIAEALRAARADLSRLADAARAVLAVEWDMVDPQHRTFAHQFREMLAAIRRLRDAVEGLEDDDA